jgi:cob(I)alamin adenosyltransferase
MAFENYQKKDSVVVVYTGDGKGKTSAGLGLTIRGLGAGWKVAFIQFIKIWEVSEHRFIHKIMPLYEEKLDFYKGGLGFFDAGELSASASREEHIQQARQTYEFALAAAKSGDYQLVVCDEINNAVHDGLLERADLERIIKERSPHTSLGLTGRNFPDELLPITDIATNMTKLKHHFDDKFLANRGIDF